MKYSRSKTRGKEDEEEKKEDAREENEKEDEKIKGEYRRMRKKTTAKTEKNRRRQSNSYHIIQVIVPYMPPSRSQGYTERTRSKENHFAALTSIMECSAPGHLSDAAPAMCRTRTQSSSTYKTIFNFLLSWCIVLMMKVVCLYWHQKF